MSEDNNKKTKDRIERIKTAAGYIGIGIVVGTANTMLADAYHDGVADHKAKTTIEVGADNEANKLLFESALDDNVEDFNKAIKLGADLKAVNTEGDNFFTLALKNMTPKHSEIVLAALNDENIKSQIVWHNATKTAEQLAQENIDKWSERGFPPKETQKQILKKVKEGMEKQKDTSYAFSQLVIRNGGNSGL